MVEIDSVETLLNHGSLTYFGKPRGRWVFRGHSDINYTLIPSVGRGPYASKYTKKYDREMFKMFRREAHGFLGLLPSSEWDWLALAQHHGLPTRLLDWTHNVLVALYFAVESNAETDGQIFALYGLAEAPETVLESSPFEIPSPVKYYPNIVSPRIRAQEGLFVACAELEIPLDQTLPKAARIDVVRVPAGRKRHLLYELFRIGIHRAALFPDLDGLAARIRWQRAAVSPFEDGPNADAASAGKG